MAKKKTSEARKTRRSSSWARTQKRKAERKEERKKVEAANLATRRAGGATPWMQAKAKRAEKRIHLQH